MYQHIKVPVNGEKITVNADFSLNVPDRPIIPYIEGDGIGSDINPVMLDVINSAVKKAYGGTREIQWMEIYAGRAKFSGWRFMPVRRLIRFTVKMSGCPKRPFRR